MEGTVIRASGWIAAIAISISMMFAAAAAAPAPAPKCQPFACPPKVATDAQKKEITKLIDQTGDDAFLVREDASRKLVEIGEVAIPQLEDAYKNSKDLEIRRRVERAVDKIRFKAVENADLPSIFVLPLHLKEAVYIYYREVAGDETYYPIDEKLGRLGHWLRTQCDVNAGSRTRPRDRSLAAEKAAMRRLVDELRQRIGDERTLAFIHKLPSKKAHRTVDDQYYGQYRWKDRNASSIQSLDRYAKGEPEPNPNP